MVKMMRWFVRNWWTISGGLLVLLLVAGLARAGSLALAAPPAAPLAQEDTPPADPGTDDEDETNDGRDNNNDGGNAPTPEVSLPVRSDVSPPLRDIVVPTPVLEGTPPMVEMPRPGSIVPPPTGDEGSADSAGKDRRPPPADADETGGEGSDLLPGGSTQAAVTTGVNFEGVSSQDNVTTLGNSIFPPDTQGDIGNNHYVQMLNNSFRVFTRDGTSVLGPLPNTALWQGFGGVCETDGEGDPITLYDHLADRWLMSQFAFESDFFTGDPSGPYYECIAISQTPDPTGPWYRYAFFYDEEEMNDYPKLGVWPDGYYMTVNEFTEEFSGGGVVVYERERMLAGDPFARQIRFEHDAWSLLPAHLEGPPPPDGTPNYLIGMVDENRMLTQELGIWEFHTDWNNPQQSTFGVGSKHAPNRVLDLPPFTMLRMYIPQPDTDVLLDALSDRPMYRLQYRNFGTHETMVFNHTVDALDTPYGYGQAGIRWYELRKTLTAPWGVEQYGTYAPDDGIHRWMGSIAMDGNGNIALGYSASSKQLSPSIGYAPRLASDPPGQLSDEQLLIAGTAPQIRPSRWGDYSTMSVDPVDDCTFWYTNEYLTDSALHWQTRIGAFRVSTCSQRLHLDKTVNTPLPVPGERITYTITLRNPSATNQTNATLVDTLPSGLTFAGPATLDPPQAGATLAQDAGDMPILASGLRVNAGQQITVTLPVTVSMGASGNLINTVSVASTQIPTPTVDTEAVFLGARLSLAKQFAPLQPQPGQPMTYTVQAYNSGSAVATGVVISDTLPAGVSFAGPVTLDPPQAGATLAQNPGDMPTLASGIVISAGQRITVTLPVTVKPDTWGGQTNVASITSAETGFPVLASAAFDISPELSLAKTASSNTVRPGDPVTYTIIVQNDGSIAATDAVISDTLPADMAFVGPVEITPPQPGATLAQQESDFPTVVSGLTIDAGARITVTVPVRVSPDAEPTHVDNVASVTSRETPEPVVSIIYLSVQLPELQVSTYCNHRFPFPGESDTCFVRLENDSSVEARQVVVTDTLPAELSFVGPVWLNMPQEGATLAQDADDLPTLASGLTIPGKRTIIITFTAKVSPDVIAGTSFTNPVSVTHDLTETPLTDSEELTVMNVSLLEEDFAEASGTTPPPGWESTILDGIGEPEVDVWHFDNPVGRYPQNISINHPFAIFDSDALSDNGIPEDVALVSPAFDASGSTFLVLIFDHDFVGGYGGKGTLELFNGTAWFPTKVYTQTTIAQSSFGTPMSGAPNSRIRFRWQGDWSYYWMVDNVHVRAIFPYQGTLDPTMQEKQGEAGSIVTGTLRLTNTSRLSDTYTLSAGNTAWETTLPTTTTGTLAPGEMTSFAVNVTIPSDARGGASNTVVVTATSKGNPQTAISATLTTRARANYGVALAPSSANRMGEPGNPVTYTLQFTNTGNVSDTFAVDMAGASWETHLVSDSRPGDVYQGGYTIPLDRGHGETVRVVVHIPADVTSGMSDTVTVRVQAQSDATATTAATLRTTSEASEAESIENLLAEESTDVVEMDSDSQQVAIGSEATYRLTIRNPGSQPHTFVVGGSGNAWDVRATEATIPTASLAAFTGTEATIEPGGEKMVDIIVTVPQSAGVGDSDTVAVTVGLKDGVTDLQAEFPLTTTAEALSIYLPLVIR